MRTKIKKTVKRILALVLSLSICITGSFIPAKRAEAGLIGNIIMGKWETIAINTVKRTISFGLSKAADYADDEELAQVFLLAQKLVAGSASVRMEQADKLLKKISAELDEMYSYTIETNNDLINKMNTLISNDEKKVFNGKLEHIRNFTSYYERMLKAYNTLFESMSAYAEDQSEANRTAFSNAYYDVYNNYYKKLDVKETFADPLLRDGSKGGFLAVISPYDQNQAIDSGDDITDPAGWTRRSDLGTTDTFLGAFYDYLLTITDLEPNIYKSLKDGAQYAANASYLYIQAYRDYVELASIMISTDDTLNDEQKLIKNTMLWSDFQDASAKVERGINQMLYQYGGDPGYPDVFGTYMRPYDLETTVKLKDFEKENSFYDEFNNYDKKNISWDAEQYDSLKEFKIKNHKIAEENRIYQFKLASDGSDKAYAIRQSDNGQNFRYEDSVENKYHDTTSPTLDTMNLLRGTENGYHTVESLSDLSALSNADNLSNDKNGTMTEYIKKELGFLLGSDNLKLPDYTKAEGSTDEDDLKAGHDFLLLHSILSWDNLTLYGIFAELDFHTCWANISMPEAYAKDIYLDLENDILDHCDDGGNDNYLKGRELTVMFTGTPTASLEISSEGNGSTVVKADGKQLSNGKNTVNSGKELSIRLKPDAGSTLSYARLMSSKGEVLEDLISDSVLDEASGQKITAQEFLEGMEKDDEGYYEFRIPVPYQDTKFEAAYKDMDPSLASYKATIKDAMGEAEGRSVRYALGQFGSHDMIGERSFREGEEVTVSVTGYNYTIPGGIVIKDKSGEVRQEVEVKDITADSVTYSPLERVYSFIMPGYDVDIEELILDSNTVTVTDTAHISHAFKNVGAGDNAVASKLPFSEGERVYIDFKAENGYFLSRTDVFYDEINEAVPVTLTESGISFIMPGIPVTVKLYEEREDMRYKLATLDNAAQTVKSLEFLDRSGWSMNVRQRQIKPGTRVSVKAVTEFGKSVKEVILKDEAGNPVSFEGVSGETDKRTGVFSFVMPAENVVISAVEGDFEPDDISSETEFTVSQPDDVVYNGSEQKQPVTLSRKDGTVLKEGRDYDIEYSDAVNIGTVTAELTGKNRFTGTRLVTYEILPAEQEIKITENPTKVYDGTPVEDPQAVCSTGASVKYSYYDSEGTLLKSNPKDAGEYTVKVSVPSCGNYGGAEASLDFTIIKALTAVDMTASDIGDIAEVKAVVFGLFEKDGRVNFVIEHEGEKSEYSASVSKAGDHYIASIDRGNIPAGEYAVTAVYESGSGNFAPSETSRTFKERKKRSIRVNEWFEKAYGDEAFNLSAKASETTADDVWRYEVISDSFAFYPAGTANAAAEPSVTVSGSGRVSVKHAGKSVIKISLSESSDDPVYQETEAYVTVYVEKAPLTVTSFAMPAEEAEGFLDDVSYGLSYSGFVNGDTRKNFTHGFGSLEPVPVREDAPASEVPYSVGIQKAGVRAAAGGRIFNNVFISRDYDISLASGSLKVIKEPEGKAVAVKSAAFDESELKLLPRGHATLKLTVTPKNCTNTTIIFRSSNEEAVSVHPDGLIMAEGKGEAWISAIVSTREGKHDTVTRTARCHVTVMDKKTESVFLDRSSVTLRPGDKVSLTACVYPEDACDADVTWESEDTGVASVKDGEVTAEAEGDTCIIARAGNAEARCGIRVIKDIADEDLTLAAEREPDELWVGRIADYTYTGSPVMPEPKVYYGNRLLDSGSDYALSYSDNTDAGTAYLTVSPKGAYAFEKATVPFNIRKADLTRAFASPAFAEVKERKGAYIEQKLIPEVRFNGKLLKEGRDFDLSYPDKAEGAYRAAGTFRIIVKGKGNFDTASELGASQVLYAKDSRTELSKAKVRLKEGSTIPAYDPAKPEKAIEPQYELYYVVKNNGVKTETVLKEGSDYTCLYTDNTKPGKAKVIFTAEKDSAFAGSKTQTFKIGSVKTDIGKSDSIKIEFPEGSTNPYLKGGVKPEVRVMNGSILLKEGSDYTLKYSNNNAVAGKKSPKVTVKGKGYYKGKKEAEFTITPQSLGNVYPVTDDFVYSDKADAYKKVKLKLYDQNGKQLSNKDYMITGFDAMSSRPKPGSIVTVRIAAKSAADKGSGLYSGSISTSFRVIEASQKLSSVRFYIAPRYYKGDPVFLSPGDISASTPPRAGNLSLTGGSDYEIVYYENNDAPGTARVILKGVGAYGGLKTVSFRINKGK